MSNQEEQWKMLLRPKAPLLGSQLQHVVINCLLHLKPDQSLLLSCHPHMRIESFRLYGHLWAGHCPKLLLYTISLASASQQPIGRCHLRLRGVNSCPRSWQESYEGLQYTARLQGGGALPAHPQTPHATPLLHASNHVVARSPFWYFVSPK